MTAHWNLPFTATVHQSSRLTRTCRKYSFEAAFRLFVTKIFGTPLPTNTFWPIGEEKETAARCGLLRQAFELQVLDVKFRYLTPVRATFQLVYRLQGVSLQTSANIEIRILY